MGRKKIREEKSKLFGTKHAIRLLNFAAHEQAHNNPNQTSPGVPTHGATWKFRSN